MHTHMQLEGNPRDILKQMHECVTVCKNDKKTDVY